MAITPAVPTEEAVVEEMAAEGHPEEDPDKKRRQEKGGRRPEDEKFKVFLFPFLRSPVSFLFLVISEVQPKNQGNCF